MLINCINTTNADDDFVINPPAILPIGARISYHGRNYVIEEILYDDESGVIDYIVAPDKSHGTKAIDSQAIEYCRSGQKLQAVKFIHDELGFGLKESKEYIDALVARYKL